MKKLASFLGKSCGNMDGMSEVILRRITSIPADGNAVSVLVPNPEDSSVGGNLHYSLFAKIFVLIINS